MAHLLRSLPTPSGWVAETDVLHPGLSVYDWSHREYRVSGQLPTIIAFFKREIPGEGWILLREEDGSTHSEPDEYIWAESLVFTYTGEAGYCLTVSAFVGADSQGQQLGESVRVNITLGRREAYDSDCSYP
jgi:hypothetical protein